MHPEASVLLKEKVEELLEKAQRHLALTQEEIDIVEERLNELAHAKKKLDEDFLEQSARTRAFAEVLKRFDEHSELLQIEDKGSNSAQKVSQREGWDTLLEALPLRSEKALSKDDLCQRVQRRGIALKPLNTYYLLREFEMRGLAMRITNNKPHLWYRSRQIMEEP